MADPSGDTAVHGDAGRLERRRESRGGLYFGLGAYTIWGFIPLYFRAVSHVAPPVVLCHRILWSALFMGLVVSLRGEWAPIRTVLRSRRNLL